MTTYNLRHHFQRNDNSYRFPTERNRKTLKVLHITDVHIDEHYEENTDSECTQSGSTELRIVLTWRLVRIGPKTSLMDPVLSLSAAEKFQMVSKTAKNHIIGEHGEVVIFHSGLLKRQWRQQRAHCRTLT